MTRFISVLVAGCVLMAVFTATALAGNTDGVTTIRVGMNGQKEVPGPGDPDGSGKVVLTLNTVTDTVCYEFTYRKIDAPAAGHIHTGNKDQSGAPVVPLFGSAANNTSGCVAAPSATIDAILASPHDYYVNVHNAVFGGGAIRGQLHPGS